MRRKKAALLVIMVLAVVLVYTVATSTRISEKKFNNSRPNSNSSSINAERISLYKEGCRKAVEESVGKVTDDFIICYDHKGGDYGMFYFCELNGKEYHKFKVHCPDDVYTHIMYGTAVPADVPLPERMTFKDGGLYESVS